MVEHRYLPEAGRVSVLMAIVLLSFALAHFLPVPEGNLSIPIFGIVLTIPLTLITVLAFISAAITATGMDWLLRTHPLLQKGESREHWLLPTVTVLVMAITLGSLSEEVWWWGFGLAFFLILVVFIAEYVVVDPTDHRYQLATAILTALGFAIFLILAVSLRASNGRLFLLAPALFLGGFFASLRTMHLQLNERWEYPWAVGIGFIAMQLGSALHYWPITPVRFGLALLAPVYALTIFAVSLVDGIPFRRAVVVPGVMLVIFISFLIWFR
jgi:hypothetical protein